MPNWCMNRITINHENVNELEKLNNLINEWTSKNYLKSDFGLNWLGNIVGNSGIDTYDGDFKVRCRGTIDYNEVIGNQLIIDTSTAWAPMIQMWKLILEKYLPDAELIYEAEECGCGLYCTNDPAMKSTYVFDACDCEDIESDWEMKEEYLIEELQKLLNTSETNVNKLLDMFDNSEWSEKISIHKYEFVEIEDCE